MKWRKEAEQEGKEKTPCAICTLEGSGVKMMPGAALEAFRDKFSQRDPVKPGQTLLGSLKVRGGKLDVAGFVAPLTSTQSPNLEMV